MRRYLGDDKGNISVTTDMIFLKVVPVDMLPFKVFMWLNLDFSIATISMRRTPILLSNPEVNANYHKVKIVIFMKSCQKAKLSIQI